MSWNDSRSRCISGVGSTAQNFSYSSDSGVTFREGGFLLLPANRVVHGDPSVAVNASTGQFYISGLLRQGVNFVGVGIVRGHFQADTLAIDSRQPVALAAADEFFDKPWMVVDSLTGNVYVTWTNFRIDDTRIELQRFDAVAREPLVSVGDGPLRRLRSHVRTDRNGSVSLVRPDGSGGIPAELLGGRPRDGGGSQPRPPSGAGLHRLE
jgi:hypothetical protein